MYTYMLSPLTSNTDSSGKGNTGNGHAPAGGSSGGQDIAGWSLKLVMEYCDQVSNLPPDSTHVLFPGFCCSGHSLNSSYNVGWSVILVMEYCDQVSEPRFC